MLLSKNSCFVKISGRFFPILWPSLNVLTLKQKLNLKMCSSDFFSHGQEKVNPESPIETKGAIHF